MKFLILLLFFISEFCFASYTIPPLSVTTGKLAFHAVTPDKISSRIIGLSPSSGNFNGSSATFASITNLTTTITTTGRPVVISAIPDGSTQNSSFYASNYTSGLFVNASAFVAIYVDTVMAASNSFSLMQTSAANINTMSTDHSCGSINTVLLLAAGSHTIDLRYKIGSAGVTFGSYYCSLVAYEL